MVLVAGSKVRRSGEVCLPPLEALLLSLWKGTWRPKKFEAVKLNSAKSILYCNIRQIWVVIDVVKL